MAELIPFVVPTQSDKVLLVWDLSAGAQAENLSVRGCARARVARARGSCVRSARAGGVLGREECSGLEKGGDSRDHTGFLVELEIRTHVVGLPQHSLFTVFSQFGLLYSVRVFPNAAVARPGFYAIIKFYSSRDAQRAQKACDGKPLFQTSPVKVRLSTRHTAVRHQAFALNSSRCQELANYYFGFTGWSKRIVKLQELSGLEGEAPPVPGQRPSLRFLCAVEVVLPLYGCRSPGVGVAEEPLHQLEEGQSSFLIKRKTAQKLAVQSALSDAFQKLAIVVLESGKVAVEYRPSEESIDAASDEELHGLIQVSCLPWNQSSQREEECLSDFSLEEEELKLQELR